MPMSREMNDYIRSEMGEMRKESEERLRKEGRQGDHGPAHGYESGDAHGHSHGHVQHGHDHSHDTGNDDHMVSIS